jgi:hypothetical protein
MPFPNDRTYSFDKNLEVSDGGSSTTASGFLQSGGVPGIIDLGGNQGTTPKQQARIDAVIVCDVTAVATGAGNLVKLFVVGSNDAGLASGNVVLGAQEVGAGASVEIPNAAASVTGRYEVFFTTQVAGVLYEYVGLYAVVAGGGSATVHAFICVLPRT